MKPLILLSNDDGTQAKGLEALINALSPLGELMVMAPDGPRSGSSCAISSNMPVSYKCLKQEKDLTIYACNGTPVDCIKLALEISKRRPDIIVSGINHGDNSSVNVHYSGTMGVVLEGCMKSIPSVGFSLCDYDPEADFTPLYQYVRAIASDILQNGLPESVCLNVNFPKREIFKGVKICRMARGEWSSEWYIMHHPHGRDYYWLTGKFTNLEPQSEDTDSYAVANGFVSITPIQIDMTAYNTIDKLKHLETI